MFQDGRLRLGDRILAVNGTSLVGADYQRYLNYLTVSYQGGIYYIHIKGKVRQSKVQTALSHVNKVVRPFSSNSGRIFSRCVSDKFYVSRHFVCAYCAHGFSRQ